MTEPCSEKENIEKLFNFHEEKMKQLHEMEKRQISIQGDITHIKERIDNGMSKTILNISEMLLKLEPTIGHHSEVIKKVEGIGWTLSTTVLIALLCLLGWGFSHGFKM